MTIYIALLRGINVSGQKPVKMDRLRSIFESMSFHRVQTYIQSGNVVFESPEESPEVLADRISHEIHREFGFEVPVLVRTLEDMEAAIERNPYNERQMNDNRKLYVTFLVREPSAAAVEKFAVYKSDVDQCTVRDREVYILSAHYGDSLFSNSFVEKKLGVPATTRNWETVNALVKMGRA